MQAIPSDDEHDVTQLLQAYAVGDPELLDRLARAVYDDLRRLAGRALQHEGVGHTLQPTVLVHDAFLRLTAQRGVAWQNREQFYRLAARTIRRLLVDHARRRRAVKRVPLTDPIAPEWTEIDPAPADRVAALDAALDGLALRDERAARVVELRYFAGLTLEEIATSVGVSLATVKRDWRFAQAFLRHALEGA